MLHYLLKNRQGQFLLVGIVLLLSGFGLLSMGHPFNRYLFVVRA